MLVASRSEQVLGDRGAAVGLPPGWAACPGTSRLRAHASTVLAEAERIDDTAHAAAHHLARQRVPAAMRLRGILPIDTTLEPLS